jgi:hypothetical protein
MMYIDSIDVIKVQRGQWKTTTKKTGPNDASRVVWAISECFFSFVFFFVLNDVYRYY